MTKQPLIVAYFIVLIWPCISCQDDVDVVVPNREIIELKILDPDTEAEISEILGNGESQIMLRAHIPHNAAGKYKSVKFIASDGKFSNNTKEEIKRPSSEGVVKTYLTVPFKSGILYLSAQIGEDTDVYYDEKVINLIDVGKVLEFDALDNSFQPITSTVKADGTTVLSLKVSANHLVENLESIEFWASDGMFIGSESSTIALSANNDAIIKFKVPQIPGEIYFSAKSPESPTIQEHLGLKLDRSYADHIILEPSSLFLTEADNSINIVTFLLRDQGLVSIGTRVEFQAFQLDSINRERTVGRFTGLAEAVTDENGKVDNVHFLTDTGDIDFDKTIYIKVLTTNDKGDVIEKTISIKK